MSQYISCAGDKWTAMLTVASGEQSAYKLNFVFHQSLKTSREADSSADPKAHRQQKANWPSITAASGSSSSLSEAFGKKIITNVFKNHNQKP